MGFEPDGVDDRKPYPSFRDLKTDMVVDAPNPEEPLHGMPCNTPRS